MTISYEKLKFNLELKIKDWEYIKRDKWLRRLQYIDKDKSGIVWDDWKIKEHLE